MEKHGHLLSLDTNVDFQSALCHPGKERCHILHSANLGNPGCARECSTESSSSMN